MRISPAPVEAVVFGIVKLKQRSGAGHSVATPATIDTESLEAEVVRL
jgi:hypothetical protein